MNALELAEVVEVLREVSRNGNTVARRVILEGIKLSGWDFESLDKSRHDYVFSNGNHRYGFRFEGKDTYITNLG